MNILFVAASYRMEEDLVEKGRLLQQFISLRVERHCISELSSVDASDQPLVVLVELLLLKRFDCSLHLLEGEDSDERRFMFQRILVIHIV